MSSNTNGTIQTRYPMIDPDPSLSKIVSNFGLKEYSIVAGTTVLAYSISWLKCKFITKFNASYRSYVLI